MVTTAGVLPSGSKNGFVRTTRLLDASPSMRTSNVVPSSDELDRHDGHPDHLLRAARSSARS